jgi:hypothetical protein
MLKGGTVIGPMSAVFGADFPPKYLPPFSWNDGAETDTYDIEKSLSTAEKVMKRRQVNFTDEQRDYTAHLFQETKKLRSSLPPSKKR